MQSSPRERSQLTEILGTVRAAMARDFLVGAIAALDASELTMIQLATMMLMSDGRTRSVKEVAAQLGRSVSAASRLLDQLVRRRLLLRRADKEDRRTRRIAIAAAGTRMVAELLDRRVEAQLRLMDELTVRERAAVQRGMTLLADAARRRSGDAAHRALPKLRDAAVGARSGGARARRGKSGEPG